MINTDKKICRDLVSLLHQYGVRHVVLCPGTRNAPLIMAVNRHPELRHTVVIDERSAAFVALGMASQSGEPVAVICTSGTAGLNFAPAIAEAFYREVPLIAITADRPERFIDVDEGQTLRQNGLYTNYIKAEVSVAETDDAANHAMFVRRLNDVLHTAVSGKKGPVHINVAINEPVGNEVEIDFEADKPRKIEVLEPQPLFATGEIRKFAAEHVKDRSVLIMCGMMAPDRRLNKSINKLTACSNIVVMHEAQSNIHAVDALGHIDTLLSMLTPEQKKFMAPDVVITVGANPLSSLAKTWLRSLEHTEHWHVGMRDCAADTFGIMTSRIEVPAADFLTQLASAIQPYKNSSNDFAFGFKLLADSYNTQTFEYLRHQPFCDLTAVCKLVEAMPSKYNLHVSNGTMVRYLQIAGYEHLHRIDVNRGVSGIDGSTSTAIGAAMAYSGPTCLMTGDMSAQYDMGALAIDGIPASFRMIVFDNQGGNIFRCIKNTRHLREVESCLAAPVNLPLADLARGFGFDYVEVADIDQLKKAAKTFFDTSDRPRIMRVATEPSVDAKAFSDFYKRKHLL